MDRSFLQIDGGRAQRRRGRFAFMIEALLRSRMSAGLETGCHRPDEDVNMYLAALLCRYAEGGPTLVHGDMIVPYEADLHARVSAAPDCRDKYEIYRHNADHLLMSLGIFGRGWLKSQREEESVWATSRDTAIGRAKAYYGKASTYATRLTEARRGLHELLAKLEIGFEDYLRILETLRGESFNLRQIFTVGEWYHFCRELGVSPASGSGPGPISGPASTSDGAG